MTKHNTQRNKTSMLPSAFEPALPASKRLQVHDLNCAPTGIGLISYTIQLQIWMQIQTEPSKLMHYVILQAKLNEIILKTTEFQASKECFNENGTGCNKFRLTFL
jgi:hypothetical protein